MKIGIYDKYLATMGGGEKHMGVLAERLSQCGHDVEIFTHKPVDGTKISRLNLDFSKIKIKIIPEQSDEIISEYTKKFDLFINSTYFSNLENRAKVGAYLTFFPIKIKDRYPKFIKVAVYKILTPLFSYFKKNHTFLKGVYGYETHGSISGLWTNGDAKLLIHSDKPFKKVKIYTHKFTPYTLRYAKIRVRINGKEISKSHFNIRKNELSIDVPKTFEGEKELTINIISKTHVPFERKKRMLDSRTLGVFITDVEVSGTKFKNFMRNILTKTKLMSLVNKLYVKKQAFSNRSALDSYEIIMANSSYTQRWIKNILEKNSILLLPPIDTEEFVPTENKKNIILNVGRFFAETEGSHNKKHLPMIKAFREMCDEGLKDWEFHLCGGSQPERIHQDYLEKVKKAAEGYPIFVHADFPFQDLKKMYSEAKIYWHASGFGEDEERNPDKFEHFGMTTAEAMSAGGVPVVIDQAGQKETVEQGVSGYRWKDLDELKEYTLKIINDEKLRVKMSKAAVKQSKNYSRTAFYKQVDSIFGHLKGY